MGGVVVDFVHGHVRWCSLFFALFASTVGRAADDVAPPEVLKRVEATLPVDAPPPLKDHVLLEFTVNLEGLPVDIAVIESAGPLWDTASTTALNQWVFKPATHDGAPVASRIRLSFTMPSVLLAKPDAGAEASDVTDGGSTPLAIISGDEVEAHPRHDLNTTVWGRGVPKSRGAADHSIELGALKTVPRKSAADYLKLAPGILLTNEGGEGHPDRIFLRGFDAREGQDIELTVDGVPINDSGNLHGNGYADLGFLIPELVEGLRVLEGPLDPRQGNYAVAGSADYQMGLTERGLLAKASYGSFDTMRLLGMWGPPGASSRTFGGVQLFRTSGFGQNREAQNAKVMAQYEGRLSDDTSFRLGAFGYGTQFRSAGVLRQDDFASGKVGFFDTSDARQGGDAARAQVHVDLHGHGRAFSHDQTAFAIYRSTRILENFTGFLSDTQLPQQNPHGQRGDLFDRDTTTVTVGARGAARWRAKLFNRNQDIELGYFGRFDIVKGVQTRLLDASNTPYKRDLDLESKLSDVGAYADVHFSPVWWLTLRGGMRAELLTYNVLNLCAQQEVRRPSANTPPGDESCLSQRDFGLYREPTERSSTSGAAAMPRGTLLLGPFSDVTFSAAAGTGIRSIDPQYIAQNLKAPFASIFSWEGGAQWQHHFEVIDANVHTSVFGTRVDKDFVFNAQEGRGIIGGSTSRLGAVVAARGRGEFFDVAGHLTWVRSQFDDTGLLVPYVPDFVARLDASAFGAIPWVAPEGIPFKGRLGLGFTYVGRRALPLGQRSDIIAVLDMNAELSWRGWSAGISVTNLLNQLYRQTELNYASDFHTSGSLPSLVPTRHFVAGAPRAVLLTLGMHLGGDS